jgi:DNA-binding MarR family transcriptional regulator
VANDYSADPLVAQIRRGATRLARRLRFERPADSLSLTKLSVLAHLHRGDAVTPGEIAAADWLQPQSLTRVLAELEADGLITRSRDAYDRRQFVLDLTADGASALAADMGARDRWLAEAMRGLSETERQVLYLAGKLMDRLSGLDRLPGSETGRSPGSERLSEPGRSSESDRSPRPGSPGPGPGPGSADQEGRVADERRSEGDDAELGEHHDEQAE